MTQLQWLLDLLQKQGEHIDRSDALSWELRNNNLFLVKSFEKLLVWTEVSFSTCLGLDSLGAEKGVLLRVASY